mmetsp:Transcript_33973/g.89364  ORF Transcript_33973/g.89364 Transcript_33973/m.89364 type:complete len:215 (+) Transcript_33973:1044-1688(+)
MSCGSSSFSSADPRRPVCRSSGLMSFVRSSAILDENSTAREFPTEATQNDELRTSAMDDVAPDSSLVELVYAVWQSLSAWASAALSLLPPLIALTTKAAMCLAANSAAASPRWPSKAAPKRSPPGSLSATTRSSILPRLPFSSEYPRPFAAAASCASSMALLRASASARRRALSSAAAFFLAAASACLSVFGLIEQPASPASLKDAGPPLIVEV